MSSHPLVGLLFRYRELVAETEALKRMARPFLAADGQGVLDTLKDDLERIGGRTTDRVQELELHPLRTQPTRDYEAGSRSGGQEIYALIKGNWELKSIGRQGPKRKVAFVGKASAVIELWPKTAFGWKCASSPNVSQCGGSSSEQMMHRDATSTLKFWVTVKNYRFPRPFRSHGSRAHSSPRWRL